MKIKWLIYYVSGSVIGLLVLSSMPTTDDDTKVLITNYIYLSIGLFFGLKGAHILEKHAWLLIVVPLIPLLLGFLGVL